MRRHAYLAVGAAIAISASAHAASTSDLLDIRGVWATSDNRCDDPDIATHIMHDRIVFIGNYAEGACFPTAIRQNGRTYVIKARCDQEGEKYNTTFNITRISAKALSIDGRRHRFCRRG